MIWEIGAALKQLILPPQGLAWFGVLGLMFRRTRPRAAVATFAAGMLLFYTASTPLVSGALMRMVSYDPWAPEPESVQPQAIVVLGGGRALRAEGGRVVAGYPAGSTVERVFTGAQLQKASGLPLLVTGGNPDGQLPTEAAVMRESLAVEFGVPVRWVEDRSRNTIENAQLSANLLRAAGIKSVYLVTNDYHLRRARLLFEAQGLAVAPVAALTRSRDAAAVAFSWRLLVPSAGAVEQTFLASNEIVGIAYARVLLRLGKATPLAPSASSSARLTSWAIPAATVGA
jgi:uncharacterized SAM-binding protein YcdF (DUF218 family)